MSHSYSLHSRVANLLIIIAALGCLFYSIFIWVVLDKFEYAILSTLVGHEVDEIITELVTDPDLKLPATPSVKGFLLSREKQIPIPDYFKGLKPNIYTGIISGEKTFHVAIHDLYNDRIYLSFDVTHLSRYGNIFRLILITGGIFVAILLLVTGIWFSRKFLLPVNQLARVVANIEPTDRNVRIEEDYRDYEVGLIAKAIDQFMIRMDEFIEREQSFTAAVSHELRTPVTIISTAVELLEMDEALSKKQRGTLNRIKKSSRQMQKVIESLLFFARHTSSTSEMTITEVLISVAFKEILSEYQQLAAEKNLTLRLRCHTNSMTRMAGGHLQIILGNLVQNAINNTSQGEICVSVLYDRFVVEDTGKGINSDDITQIIDRCYRSPDSKGCGLGLHLVMNICNHFDFKLEIESQPGVGSKFTVKYPDSMIQEVKAPTI